MATDVLSKENFALKLDVSGGPAGALFRETQMGKRLSRPNVVATYDLIKHNDSHRLGFLMERAGVSLHHALIYGVRLRNS